METKKYSYKWLGVVINPKYRDIVKPICKRERISMRMFFERLLEEKIKNMEINA